MSAKYRLEGIYDSRTIKAMSEIGLVHLQFDARPTSFNFLPQYLLDELVKGLGPTHKSFIHFCGEQDYIIKKVIDELPFSKGGEGPLFLEFSDDRDVSFYESFHCPFFWHYKASENLGAILMSPLLKGIVFDISFLSELHEKGLLRNFAQNFYSMTLAKGANDIKLILRRDWNSEQWPSLNELFDFDLISLPVNPSVEVCYRNANLAQITNGIKAIKREL